MKPNNSGTFHYGNTCQYGNPSHNADMSKKKPLKFSDQIRQAVRACGLSNYRISQETGISEPTLSRFMSGKRGLPMRTLDVLAEYLKLRVVSEEKRK